MHYIDWPRRLSLANNVTLAIIARYFIEFCCFYPLFHFCISTILHIHNKLSITVTDINIERKCKVLIFSKLVVMISPNLPYN